MKMWLPRSLILLVLLAVANCKKDEDQDASNAFMDAARSLFTDKDAIGGLQGMANAFVQSDAGKQVGDILGAAKSGESGVGQIISGLGNLISGGQQNQDGSDLSMFGSILDSLSSGGNDDGKRTARDTDAVQKESSQNTDIGSVLNMGSMLFGQTASSDLLMGLLPMILDGLAGISSDGDGTNKPYDHSGHAWYMPPILEHIHVMWDHFSNSELGQTLWKKSGLAKIIEQMTDSHGRIQYEKILDSFDSPMLRRRWIKSLTNFVAEWFSHISDPVIQQRYFTTAQFIGNSFLKSQGFPKSVMFDMSKPTESISRLVNAVAKRHLGLKLDSSMYIKPAVAYFQELMALASEKGFIMSRVNARELSNRLSDTINNDIIAPILKAYRAYKWAIKSPQCASQILCSINEYNVADANRPLRNGLAKVASFPAAWAVSNKSGISFWSLYGAITENDGCIKKYPADCAAFHEEELKATTEEAIHNEL